MLLFGRPRFPQIGTLIVDRNHSLARGLRDCVVFNTTGRHGLVNLADPGLNVTTTLQGTGALPSWSATADGVACTTVAVTSSDGGQISITDQGPVTAGDCAFRVRFICNGFPASVANAAVVSKVVSSRELGLFLNSSTSLISQINLGAQVTNPGGNAITTGAISDILVTKTAGVGVLYQNGVATVSGLSLSGTATATAVVSLGTDTGHGGNSFSGSYLQFQTWTRNITAAEALQLYLDPFCFLTTVPLQVSNLFSFPPPPPLPMMGQIWI